MSPNKYELIESFLSYCYILNTDIVKKQVDVSFLCLFQLNFQFKLTSNHSFRSVYLETFTIEEKRSQQSSSAAGLAKPITNTTAVAAAKQ